MSPTEELCSVMYSNTCGKTTVPQRLWATIPKPISELKSYLHILTLQHTTTDVSIFWKTDFDCHGCFYQGLKILCWKKLLSLLFYSWKLIREYSNSKEKLDDGAEEFSKILGRMNSTQTWKWLTIQGLGDLLQLLNPTMLPQFKISLEKLYWEFLADYSNLLREHIYLNDSKFIAKSLVVVNIKEIPVFWEMFNSHLKECIYSDYTHV